VGAAAATAAGVALGAIARVARGPDGVTALARSAPARLVTAALDLAAAQLDAAGVTTTQRWVLGALGALVVVAVAAGARAVVLWLGAGGADLRTHAAHARAALAGAMATTRRRATPAAPVRALAARGATRAQIARRTGLSRDAVALAMNLRG
jgi:hypothetical protein